MSGDLRPAVGFRDAEALTRRLEEAAREEGCDRLEATSGEWREDAHTFYRELGFEETSKRFIKPL
jgi:GNAT superfamily N-acetyltransferase